MLTDLHKRLLNDFQRDFPISPTPYADIANDLGVSETDVLNAFSELNDKQFISRIGAIIPPNHIGVSTLVAMAVADEQLTTVAEKISAYSEVNHNYEREHRFNLWFVVIARDAQHLNTVMQAIEQDTGYSALQLPLLNEFFIDLGFQLDLAHV